MITDRQFKKFLLDFDKLMEVYRKEYSVEVETNCAEYEFFYERRIRKVTQNLRPLVNEACKNLSVNAVVIGRPHKISLADKATILLLKTIFKISNRKMAYMLGIFNSFTNLNISYKSVERVYSDPSVMMTLHNLFVLTIKKEKLKTVDLSGDGTGYSLTITKHYRTQGRKDNGKEKCFVYNFAFKDLDTGLYVGYGIGLRSEREAYNNARRMLFSLGLKIVSIRLDKYYGKSDIDAFGNETRVYIIPKKNAVVNGSPKWHQNIKELMEDTMSFFAQYYLRNHSESGFSADKRSTGWLITQKRDDRIETASIGIGLWHNLLLMHNN